MPDFTVVPKPRLEAARPRRKQDKEQPPEWARTVIRAVARQAGREMPRVRWVMRKPKRWTYRGAWDKNGDGSWYQDPPREIITHKNGHGVYRLVGDYITIWPHTNSDYQDFTKGLLLHELTHWLVPGYRHDETFWKQAFTLYRRYHVSKQWLADEWDYRARTLRNGR